MIGVLYKNKVLVMLLIAALVIAAILLWVLLANQNLNKIPSRGIFV